MSNNLSPEQINLLGRQLSQLGNMRLAEKVRGQIGGIRGTNAGLHSAYAKCEPIMYDRFGPFDEVGNPANWARCWNEVRAELGGWKGDVAKVYKKEIDRRIRIYGKGEDAVIRPAAIIE